MNEYIFSVPLPCVHRTSRSTRWRYPIGSFCGKQISENELGIPQQLPSTTTGNSVRRFSIPSTPTAVEVNLNKFCLIKTKNNLHLKLSFLSPNNGDSLEPNSQGFENEYDVEKYTESLLPYGIQNVRDLMQYSDRPLRNKPARDLRVSHNLNNYILNSALLLMC